MRHVPNLLTCLRIVLALYFPFAPPTRRLTIAAVALLTEYLDGALARKFGWTSRFGLLLDPAADKLFFLAVVITLVRAGLLTWGAVALLGIRDLCVIAAVVWALGCGLYSLIGEMRPTKVGKAATVGQYLAFFDILITGRLHVPVLVIGTALSAAAAVQYWTYFRKMRQSNI
ncbi:MAG: CDP-alcohol phosphatidyltransferase family protein [Elusimicrobia bacterium]|nr:CDP-alcohol phosphatidyltransferase family protein [Elusimicrobiota bacterium]